MTEATLNNSRLTAMSFVGFGEEKGPEIEVLLNCMLDDGKLVIENKSLREAIDWLHAFRRGQRKTCLK